MEDDKVLLSSLLKTAEQQPTPLRVVVTDDENNRLVIYCDEQGDIHLSISSEGTFRIVGPGGGGRRRAHTRLALRLLAAAKELDDV